MKEFIIILLLLSLFLIFLSVCKKSELKIGPENVSMKNSPYCSQLFLSTNKIQRIIPTLSAKSFSITRFCEELGIDRLSSHPCENRIGNIRSEYLGDHSIENVLNSASRCEYLKGSLKSLDLKEDRQTRLNLGGCKTSMGNIDFDFSVDEKTLADLIMKIGYY